MTNNIPTFSLENFLTDSIPRAERLEIVAEIQTDGPDHYVLNPNPCEPTSVYRISRQAVDIGRVDTSVSCEGKQKKLLHNLTIDPSAPCLRMSVSTAEFFLGPRAVDDVSVTRTLRASISFSGNGEGQLSFGGRTIQCLGNPSINYNKDLTIQGVVGTDKFLRKYSNEYSVWMDYAVLIMGQRGIYIHEGASTLPDNGGEPSAGCIHVANPDAKRFYDWITGRTRILISYPW